jgi:hypothetical protein
LVQLKLLVFVRVIDCLFMFVFIWYIVADEAVLMKFYASFVGVNQAEIYGM